MRHDPGRHRLHLFGRAGQQLIAWTKGVEDHVAVDQQVFAALRLQAHRVRKNLERIHLGDLLDPVDRLAALAGSQYLIEQGIGLLGEGLTDLRDGAGRQDARQHGTGPGVIGWIGLQDQTLGPKRWLFVEVGQAHASRGNVVVVVVEYLPDLLMATGDVNAVVGDPCHRPELSQARMVGIGIAQHLGCKRVDMEHGHALGLGQQGVSRHMNFFLPELQSAPATPT